ncbi:MAG: hypothetical protein R3C32_03075 [Chloroflexota bacterium]
MTQLRAQKAARSPTTSLTSRCSARGEATCWCSAGAPRMAPSGSAVERLRRSRATPWPTRTCVISTRSCVTGDVPASYRRVLILEVNLDSSACSSGAYLVDAVGLNRVRQAIPHQRHRGRGAPDAR